MSDKKKNKEESVKTQVDEALDETFPASDPPSWMPKSDTQVDDEELSEDEKEKHQSARTEKKINDDNDDEHYKQLKKKPGNSKSG